MSIQNSNDILKSLLDEAKKNSEIQKEINENDIMKKISQIDKNAVTKKLRSMGLGSVADKLNSLSDKELTELIKKNPGILKKAKDFIK